MRRYRATPHAVTGDSPFEAMYGRRMKIDLPLDAEEGKVVDRARVERSQAKMLSKKGKQHDLTVGDRVLTKQAKRNKLAPAYSPSPQ